MRNRYCKNIYILEKLIIAICCFSKLSIVDVQQGSEYACGSEYPKILNMSLVLNVSVFCMYRSSEYASGFEYARILNIEG